MRQQVIFPTFIVFQELLMIRVFILESLGNTSPLAPKK